MTSQVLQGESLADLAALLVKARIARRWTQRQLADALGIAEQQVQRYEATGYRSASLARISDVAGRAEPHHHRRGTPAGRSGLSACPSGADTVQLLRLQEPPDGVRRRRLHRLEHVAVAVQSDLRGGMAVAFAHHLRVHPGEQGHRRRRMPEVMEGYFRQARSTLQRVEVTSQLSRMVRVTKLVHEDVLGDRDSPRFSASAAMAPQ